MAPLIVQIFLSKAHRAFCHFRDKKMILAFFPLQLLHEDMNNINALFIYGGWTERSQKVTLVPVASAEP